MVEAPKRRLLHAFVGVTSKLSSVECYTIDKFPEAVLKRSRRYKDLAPPTSTAVALSLLDSDEPNLLGTSLGCFVPKKCKIGSASFRNRDALEDTLFM